MAKTERSAHTTTDHDFIRRWVEDRGGWPARVKGTGDRGDAGLIRIDFPGFSGEGSLERIEWDEWLEGFEANNLAFLHRDLDHGDDDLDRFNKLVSRTGEDGGGSSSKSSGSKSSGSKSSGSKSSSSKSSGSGSSSKPSGGSSGRKAADTGSAKKSPAKSGGAGEGEDEATSEMRELLKHELGDLLFAERQFVTATRTLAREAQDAAVKARLEEHVTETEGQVERLKEAFAAIGEKAKAETCEAALGLKEEHASFKSDEKPSKQLLSAFDLGSGLRVEHYEIAAYRTAIAVAEALGEKECSRILKENLEEEVAMAAFLEKNAPRVLKQSIADGRAKAKRG